MNLARSTRKKADFQRLNYCNFNGTQECFVIATDSGFSVFNVDPFRERVERVLGGGLGIVEMLNSTNYLALVGGGRNPKWSDNKVVIWDDTKQKSVMELDFTSSVRAVRLRRDRIIVVLENKVIVYSFASPPEKLHTFETCDNELGLCALAPLENNVLAFPGRTEGFIQIAYLSNSSHLSPDQPTRMTRASPNISIIHAHAGSLSCLNISQDGKLVASASAVGTLIRLWSAATCTMVAEFRRGLDTAVIYSISFSPPARSMQRLAVTSDKGTIHIFDLPNGSNDVVPQNKHSFFANSYLIPFLPKYFKSEWSAAQAHITDTKDNDLSYPTDGGRCITGWKDERCFIVLASNGGYWKYIVPEWINGHAQKKEKECSREAFRRFIR